MSEKGELTETKTVQKRDEKGRFLSGSKGGPGRGNKKQQKISMDEIELALQRDLKSKDSKIRHSAAKLLLILKRQMSEPDNNTEIIDPELWAVYGHCFKATDDNNSKNQDNTILFARPTGEAPGRGHKNKLFENIESMLQDDLKSKDPKVRHPAVKLLLMLKRQMKEPDEGTPIIDPVLRRMYSQCFAGLQDEVEVIDDEFTSESSSNEAGN